MVGVTDRMLARAVDELVGRLVAGRDIDESVNLEVEEEEVVAAAAAAVAVEEEDGIHNSEAGEGLEEEKEEAREEDEEEGVSADAIAVLEHAATIIQAGVRGMLVRSGVSEKHDTALERIVDSFIEEHLPGAGPGAGEQVR